MFSRWKIKYKIMAIFKYFSKKSSLDAQRNVSNYAVSHKIILKQHTIIAFFIKYKIYYQY